jgi:hypothetical protein
MGYVTCGIHPKTRCCWKCDRCPICDDCGRLLRGDYCRACTAAIQAAGGVWSVAGHHRAGRRVLRAVSW